MRTSTVVQIGIAALVGALVVAGLATVGGPMKGRTEKRDQTRLSDLREISTFVRCVADTQAKTLPDTLAPFEACRRELRIGDPYTGTPYRYEKVSDTAYQVCADFEDLPWMIENVDRSLDPETGCLSYSYTKR
ncbi:hypothetical protein [Actibacterium sp.]|uniref:hypothetical protein n=1 Tax=Actibacterium sp. TaxID=1872125 RepID=UPI003563399A